LGTVLPLVILVGTLLEGLAIDGTGYLCS